MQEEIRNSFNAAQKTLEQFCTNEQNLQIIEQIGLRIAQTYRELGKVIIFGNGGSMCDAMHFAEELTGRFIRTGSPWPPSPSAILPISVVWPMTMALKRSFPGL